jgi:hypothetical protein
VNKEKTYYIVQLLYIVIKICIIQMIAYKFGTAYLGEYSKVFFPASFLASIFTFSVQNLNIYHSRKLVKPAILSLNNKIIFILNLFCLPILVVYFVFLKLDISLIVVGSFNYLSISWLFIINSVYVVFGNYLRVALNSFFQFFIFFVMVIIQSAPDVLLTNLYWMIANFIIVAVNLKVVYLFIFKGKVRRKMIAPVVSRIVEGFVSDTSNFLINRGDFLFISFFLQNKLVGIYYLFIQVLDGFRSLVVVVTPIIQRELGRDRVKSFRLTIVLLTGVLLTLAILNITFKFWHLLISGDLETYRTYFLFWSFVIFVYCFKTVLFYLNNALGFFKNMSVINFFVIVPSIISLYLFREYSLLGLIFVKLGSFFTILVCYLYLFCSKYLKPLKCRA